MKVKCLVLFITMLLLQGCKKDQLCNCLESAGGSVSETRKLADFIEVEMNNNVDIILSPDTSDFVVINCGKNLMDGIRTEVIDGKLVIHNVNKCNWLRDFKNKFTATVHYKSIRQITTYGSGNLNCADTVRENYLKAESWSGTGELNFLFNGDEIYLKLHTGPGDITASGKANVMYSYSAGNGFIRAAGLKSDYVNVTTKSTGDCEVNAVTKLDAEISYNGDVYYKGNPVVINKKISGTGKLIPF